MDMLSSVGTETLGEINAGGMTGMKDIKQTANTYMSVETCI